MANDKSTHLIRYDTSSRLHIIVLYLLIASLTLSSGIYFLYFSRNVQIHIDSVSAELNVIKQRLSALESTEITISSSNGYDPLRRQSRHARIKTKSTNKQIHQRTSETESSPADLLLGSIHFKVPVCRTMEKLVSKHYHNNSYFTYKSIHFPCRFLSDSLWR